MNIIFIIKLILIIGSLISWYLVVKKIKKERENAREKYLILKKQKELLQGLRKFVGKKCIFLWNRDKVKVFEICSVEKTSFFTREGFFRVNIIYEGYVRSWVVLGLGDLKDIKVYKKYGNGVLPKWL